MTSPLILHSRANLCASNDQWGKYYRYVTCRQHKTGLVLFFQFITALLVAVASAGRLENTYLPPSTARFAGGSGNVLAAPSLGLGAPTSYSAPAFGGVPVPGVTTAAFNGFVGVAPTPSVSYGVPVAAVKTYSAPVTPPVPILRLNSDNNGDGSYRYE